MKFFKRGATVITGAMFIPESRVTDDYDMKFGISIALQGGSKLKTASFVNNLLVFVTFKFVFLAKTWEHQSCNFFHHFDLRSFNDGKKEIQAQICYENIACAQFTPAQRQGWIVLHKDFWLCINEHLQS